MLIHSPQELALLIISQRKKLKLSQGDVANRVGLRQATVSYIENKPEGTKLDTLFNILSAVNLDIYLVPKNKSIPEDKGWNQEW